jgi:hypothetical protein
MTTTKNLQDLAEVLRALAESGLWAPDRDLFYDLPDPSHATTDALVDALAGIVGEDVEIVDTWSVHQWGTAEAASPLDAEAAAALLVAAGAYGYRGEGTVAYLRVGEPVPGGVWVTAHAIHGDVRNLSGDKQYADALARLVRDHWERARPAFVDDVKDATLRYVTEYLEALPEVIEGLDKLADRLVRAAGDSIADACTLSEFDRGLERGDGRGIDIDGAEFRVDHDGEVIYRDWGLVVHRVADAEAAEIIRKWEASRK